MPRQIALAGWLMVFCGVPPFVAAQTAPTKLQSSSTITASAQNIEIHNVTYDVTSSGTPGRPRQEDRKSVV